MDKIYGASNSSPFTEWLKQSDDGLFKDLRAWFRGVSENVKKRRDKSDGSECTLRGQSWIDEAIIYMTDRNLTVPDKSCATRTEHEGKNLIRAISLMDRTNKAFAAAGTKILKNEKKLRELWPPENDEAFVYKDIEYERDDQKCKLNYLTAISIGKERKWYVLAAMTSVDVNRGGKRFRFVEHVATDFSQPLVMQLSSKNDREYATRQGKPKNQANRTEFTTTFAEAFGGGQISRILRMHFDDNRALMAALDANLLRVDQATDAVTPANFSILILPLLMSFIPVALIADVSDVATFFYVLLTDVFSAVPFVIKGVELVITGTTQQRNAETWLVGEDQSTQIAETWVAECSPQVRFRDMGIIVIAVGLGAIIFGILLEHFARKWMSRRRDKGEHPEPFGPALLRMDAFIPVGANFVPANASYDDPLAPNASADLAPPPPAAGPNENRAANLFSGLLRRNPRLHRRNTRAATSSESQQSPVDQHTRHVPGLVPPLSLGVVSQQEPLQGPPRGSEYDDP